MTDQMALFSPQISGSNTPLPLTTWGTEPPYHGASHRREAMRAWNPSRGSADRDVVFSLDTLRNRSRDLVRNVPVAAAAVLTMTTNVVGCGIHPRPRLHAEMLGITPDEAHTWENTVRHLWEMWAGSKNSDAERKNTFYQQQDLALRTKLVAGNCFALTPYRPLAGCPFGLCVKLLDGDRAMNPIGAIETDCIAGGVEVDPLGAPVAYHFSVRPPYGIIGDMGFLETVRVPAFGDLSGRPLVLHLFSPERPDQRLGVPWLSPVIEVIKQQGRYQDAELMAAVVSGMFTVFVKTASGSPDWKGNVPDKEVEHLGISAERGEVALKYGGVVDLAEDESIETANPNRPNPNYDPFVNSIFREITAGLGLPVEQVLKRFDSSYTAARAAMLEGWKTYRRARADLCVDFCQPVYENALVEFIAQGLVEAPGFFDDPMRRALWSSAAWVGEAPGQLNPVVETQAMKMQVDEQFKDRTEATLELTGGDYPKVVEGLSREKALRTAAGLPEPGAVQKTETATTAMPTAVDLDGNPVTPNTSDDPGKGA